MNVFDCTLTNLIGTRLGCPGFQSWLSLTRLKMDASPVLDYLAKDNLPSLGALGPVSLLRAFAKSVGRKFIKGHAFGERLWPEKV